MATEQHDDLDAFSRAESEADPAFKAALEDAQLRRSLIEALVAARRAAALTQEAVAERMRTTQSTVSEFEGVSGDKRLSTLQRYARAVGKRVRVVIDDPNQSTEHYIVEQIVGDFGRVDGVEWHVGQPQRYTMVASDGPEIALAS